MELIGRQSVGWGNGDGKWVGRMLDGSWGEGVVGMNVGVDEVMRRVQ